MKRVVQYLSETTAGRRMLTAGGLILALVFLYKVVYPWLFDSYVGQTNGELTYANSVELTDAQFDALARELTEQSRYRRAASTVERGQDRFARRVKIEMLMSTPSFLRESGYPHIKYFRDAGIRRYVGPKTCLGCHETMQVNLADGHTATVDTLEDIVESVHYKFQSDAGGFSTYGYDGREVNAPGVRRIPVGKINRACGIPGSFSWTGWAALVESRPEDQPAQGPSGGLAAPQDDGVVMRSEGCGQCHIGGNYHPATEKMMPIGDVSDDAKQGVDCLICHAAEYDMNQRYVIRDKKGLRWNQDRSLRAALTVGHVSNKNCLNCHQHNLGGDVYLHNEAAKHLGYRNQRLLHAGAKRGNPFSPEDDVHAAAGIECTDCHVPEGHKIPRGRFGVDLVANDLPDKEVSCENCHSQAPHNSSEDRALLNGHIARIACETCHIPQLQDSNLVLRDWVHPTWNAAEGVFKPTDIYRSGKPGKGLIYLWFNGNGTFLANALGNNPNGGGDYDPLMRQIARIEDPEVIAAVRAKAEELKQRYADIDVDAYVRAATDPLSQMSPEMLAKRRRMIDENLRPVMSQGSSRIYPFKRFNAMMYEDMSNQGPFGAMILPFDYAVYYETGDPKASVARALQDPIVVRMYQTPFKLYMMDEFMAYFGVEGGWNTVYPLQNGGLRNVEAHWMRQMGTLMVNHGIQRAGLTCQDCHSADGILDYVALGYTPERAKALQRMDIVEGD